MACGGVAFGQQLKACEMRRVGAESQHLQQVAARAATHLRDAQAAQVGDAARRKAAQHRALAFLQAQVNLGAQGAVEIAGDAAGVALRHGFGFGFGFGFGIFRARRFVHDTASMKRCASTG